MSILFCAYRTWATDAFKEIEKRHPSLDMLLISSQEEFYFQINEYVLPEIIILAGWSWIVPKDIVDNIYIVGFPPL